MELENILGLQKILVLCYLICENTKKLWLDQHNKFKIATNKHRDKRRYYVGVINAWLQNDTSKNKLDFITRFKIGATVMACFFARKFVNNKYNIKVAQSFIKMILCFMTIFIVYNIMMPTIIITSLYMSGNYLMNSYVTKLTTENNNLSEHVKELATENNNLSKHVMELATENNNLFRYITKLPNITKKEIPNGVQFTKNKLTELEKQIKSKFSELQKQTGGKFAELQKQTGGKFAELNKQTGGKFAELNKQTKKDLKEHNKKSDAWKKCVEKRLNKHLKSTIFEENGGLCKNN